MTVRMPPYTCPRCDRGFDTYLGMRIHRGSRHNPDCWETETEALDHYCPERPPGGCWVWEGPACRSHLAWYGSLCRRGVSWMAHRWVYTILRGPIPEGHDVHHLCGTTLCVNPDHLCAVSTADHWQLHQSNDPTMLAMAEGELVVPY